MSVFDYLSPWLRPEGTRETEPPPAIWQPSPRPPVLLGPAEDDPSFCCSVGEQLAEAIAAARTVRRGRERARKLTGLDRAVREHACPEPIGGAA